MLSNNIIKVIHLKYFLFVFLFTFLKNHPGISNNVLSDKLLINFGIAFKYNEIIESYPDSIKIKTVTILGNSIVLHSPKPEIEWYGNWGMAASVKDSDFVHLLIRDITRIDNSVNIKFANIADFERNYTSYPLKNLEEYKSSDILIMKIAENVDDNIAIENGFIDYYDKLIKYLTPKDNSIIIIADGFFNKKSVNKLIENYANEKKYHFVSLKGLSQDSTNKAVGKFKHKGVAGHPSDKGMRMIEKQIWQAIRCYFLNDSLVINKGNGK